MSGLNTRRGFLGRTVGAAAGLALGHGAGRWCAAETSPSLIASIEKAVLREGRTGRGPTWFHPRACMVPGPSGAMALMTLQPIAGSDYFGPVHWMTSSDLGRRWTEPKPVPALGRVKQTNGSEEGVCDVVPEWHAKTKTVLALGHNVFYSGPRFSANQPPRWPIYAVWRDGQWVARRKLEWDDPRGTCIYTNGCGQRVVLPNGDILLAFSYGSTRNKPRSVSGVICAFAGPERTSWFRDRTRRRNFHLFTK